MKIVITGALGHIGSSLIRALPHVEDWPEIVMVDNLSSQRYCSLFDLPNAAAFRFVEADILTADLNTLMRDADAVVHLAAITNAAESFGMAEEVERVNLVGTQRVAEACAQLDVPMVFVSTTSVYGPQADVVDEDCGADGLRPQSPYAASKLRAEHFLEGYMPSGLRFVTYRFGTIFGVSPGMRFHTAVNKFCWQALTGVPATVWKTALDQRRPYLDLTDAVAALLWTLRHRHFDGRVYNVVTVNASVRDILDEIRTHVCSLDIEYVDSPIMNQLSYNVSSARFEGLGFRFAGDLSRGIGDTMRLLSPLVNRAPAQIGTD